MSSIKGRQWMPENERSRHAYMLRYPPMAKSKTCAAQRVAQRRRLRGAPKRLGSSAKNDEMGMDQNPGT